jgi:DNA primase
LQVKCPYHDDHNPSAVVYKDNGYFKCYSCLAERSFSRLYKDLLGVEWDGKLSLSLTMFGDKARHEIAQRVKQDSRKKKLPGLSQNVFIEGVIKKVSEVPEAKAYCDSRDIHESFIEVFDFRVLEFGYCNGKPWRKRLLIPFVEGGFVKSVEGRDYTRAQSNKVLYPLNGSVDFIFNWDNLNTGETLIVTEGVMDVHKIWQWVSQNVTCTFGVNLQERQKEMLREFKDVILFIYADGAGRLSIRQFEKFYPGDFRVAVIKGKDPGDGSRQELEEAVKNAKPFNIFLMEDVGLFPEKKRLSLN